MDLILANQTSRVFEKLDEQWRAQCATYGEDYEEYCAGQIDYSRGVATSQEDGVSSGVHVLMDEESCECFAHLNTARLPQTHGVTLRVVWITVAPKYDFEDVAPDRLARIAASLFAEIIQMAQGKRGPRMAADHIKVQLTGIADRRFMVGFAAALQQEHRLDGVAIRGNWLHMSLAAPER